MSDFNENRIGFSLDVATSTSEENINKVIDKIDNLKDKIAELKDDRKGTQGERFAKMTSEIRETERELQKLTSVYNSWIQKATEIDTTPIGNVKKQTKELLDVLSQWDGKSKTFNEQVMKRFLIPNSAIDQAKVFKDIIAEINGAVNKGFNMEKGFGAISEFNQRLQKARTDAAVINELAKNGGTMQEASARVATAAEKERLKVIKQQTDLKIKQQQVQRKNAQLIKETAKTAIDQYSAVVAKLQEVQAKIRLNYINNRESDPKRYAENVKVLSKEYEFLSNKINKANRELAIMNFQYNKADMIVDKFLRRASWVLSNYAVGGVLGVASNWGNTISNVEKEMAQFNQVMPHDQGAATAMGRIAQSMGLDELANEMTSMPWDAFAQKVTAGEHSVNLFGKTLRDVDFDSFKRGMQESTGVSDDFRADLEKMQKGLLDLGVKYGESHENVIKSATLWGRMYKDNNIVLQMTDAAMKLAVADSFSIVEANKNLESSVAQWGFQIKNATDAQIVANKVCDSWTAIAHNMAVSAQDLSAANQRSAAAMRAIGIDFDTGQALLATMLRNTQQAGGEIGNAMKSIVGSIHSDKAIKDLEALGVQVYEFGENGQKQFRKVSEVLVDLMIKTQGTKTNLEDLLKDISGGKPFAPVPSNRNVKHGFISVKDPEVGKTEGNCI